MPKGIYIHKPLAEKHKQNISLALKGKNVGENNGMFGKSHSKKWKQRMSKVHKKLGTTPPHPKDENHPRWKGDGVGYDALHSWIQRKLGKAQTCIICKGAKTPTKTFQWANISREYKRVLEDWVELCSSCHRIFDYYKLTISELFNRG